MLSPEPAKNHPQGTASFLVKGTRSIANSRHVTKRFMPDSLNPNPGTRDAVSDISAGQEDDSDAGDEIDYRVMIHSRQMIRPHLCPSRIVRF